MQQIIIGNFGNHSLAVLQALIERALPNLYFIYVETGWAAASWAQRVQVCTQYAMEHGVIVQRLIPPATLTELVLERKQFPTQKFQWCASFLKGLAILNYLDEIDPGCEARIISGKRRQDSRRYADLPEFDYDNDLFQGRTIWHPLWRTSNNEFIELIHKTGFSVLPQQSLECSPCIHANQHSVDQLDEESVQRLDNLEKRIGQTMFHQPITHLCSTDIPNEVQAGLSLHQFDRGCGSPWGCGE